MKKYFILSLLIAFSLPLCAQHDNGHHGRKHKEVTEMVGNLSAAQKRKIESISKESRQHVDNLRKQQKAVRDSIAMYMELEGDQSALLYPLFDREAAINVAIGREMYAGKVRIDEVLTKEQRAELRNAAKNMPRKKK